MLFGASFACTRCSLRFARRPACPSCGGAVVSLAESAGRRAMQRARFGAPSGRVAMTLARWAPARPWIPLGIGLLAMAPAIVSLLFVPSSLQNAWFVDDRTGPTPKFSFEYEGLSSGGFRILAAGVAGLVFTVFVIAAILAARKIRSAPTPLRVHAPAAGADGADLRRDEAPVELTGTATLATVEVESALARVPRAWRSDSTGRSGTTRSTTPTGATSISRCPTGRRSWCPSNTRASSRTVRRRR
ncbi:MAG: hypothetical protein U0169_24885 [Polyangiaceae bacterium]